MPTVTRNRDCVVHMKSDSFTVALAPSLIASGWTGGSGVMWSDSGASDKFMVEQSDGLYGGMLLFGSDELSDKWTGLSDNQTVYSFATICTGGWVVSTVSFETYTWASRQAGPLVAITYTAGEKLYLYLRGLYTNADEWSESGDPRAPNTFVVGRVVAAPSVTNNYYLTAQTNL